MAAILLVEDNETLRELYRMVLEDAGHQVSVADGGRPAITLLETRRYDVVVTDVVMPEGDGLEVLHALRLAKPHPPVIVMSGGGHIDPDHYLRMARILGAVTTLQKPFEPSVLVQAVDRALAQPPKSTT